MSVSVPQSFIQIFDSEVKLAYQRDGSYLRNTVFQRSKVGAERIYFPLLGAVESNTKARHADVTLLNPDHSRAAADMVDRYAPLMIDELDEVKTNQDLRMSYSRTSGMALGRFTDQQIVDSLATSPHSLDATTINTAASFTPATALSQHVVSAVAQDLGERDVPYDNQRFAVVGPDGLADMQQYVEGFASSLFSTNRPLQDGKLQNFWMGFNWVLFTGLPPGVKGFFYHRRAVGHGIAKDVTTRIGYVDMKAAWLVNSFMSMGATLIDPDGVTILTEA